MKISTIPKAEDLFKQLNRWRNLKATFTLIQIKQPLTIETRVYYIDTDEEMWSQYIKEFDIKSWYGKGAKAYGHVFESCQGLKRNVVYVHTPMYALRLITKEYIPVGAKLVEIDYL